MIKNIKYCRNINIPEILIDNNSAVEKESKKTLAYEILVFSYILRKILTLKYVDNIHPNKNGISVVLKKPCPIK